MHGGIAMSKVFTLLGPELVGQERWVQRKRSDKQQAEASTNIQFDMLLMDLFSLIILFEIRSLLP